MANVLVVEDDAALAELLVWHLTQEGHTVRVTPDGDDALVLIAEQLPDLILLDWMIEGTSGIELCRRLRRDEATASVTILMLTARGEEEDRIRGLKTGADDYVTKPFSPRELLARVEALLRRSQRSGVDGVLRQGDIALDPGTHMVTRAGLAVHLGPTEFRLLRHFLERQGRVLSRSQLLDAVWGHDQDIELRTVDVHIRRLRKALGEPDPIRTVRAAGYALGG